MQPPAVTLENLELAVAALYSGGAGGAAQASAVKWLLCAQESPEAWSVRPAAAARS